MLWVGFKQEEGMSRHQEKRKSRKKVLTAELKAQAGNGIPGGVWEQAQWSTGLWMSVVLEENSLCQKWGQGQGEGGKKYANLFPTPLNFLPVSSNG